MILKPTNSTINKSGGIKTKQNETSVKKCSLVKLNASAYDED